MALKRVLNDPRATRITGIARHEAIDMNPDGGDEKTWEDPHGLVLALGRGVTDPRITYIAQFNTSGVKVYTYPNAAGDGLVTTTVQP